MGLGFGTFFPDLGANPDFANPTLRQGLGPLGLIWLGPLGPLGPWAGPGPGPGPKFAGPGPGPQILGPGQGRARPMGPKARPMGPKGPKPNEPKWAQALP